MSVEENVYLSLARKVLSQISGVFGSMHQQGSAKHQEVFRMELVRHLDAAELQQVPLEHLISFGTTLQCMEGVGEVLAEVTLALISKSAEEGLRNSLTPPLVRSYYSYCLLFNIGTYIYVFLSYIVQVCVSVYRNIWLYFNPLWGFLKSSVETYFLKLDFFCLFICHVNLGDFVEAGLALYLAVIAFDVFSRF